MLILYATNMQNLSVILACNFNGGIGYKNEIPWNIPEEMKKFRDITTSTHHPDKKNAVIMGRKTWSSLKKSLPNRLNVVITSHRDFKSTDNETIVSNSIKDAITVCRQNHDIEKIFIIGGSGIYNEVIKNCALYNVEKIYLSVIFYDKESRLNYDTYVNIKTIFKKFDIYKDINYSQHADNRLFASFVCFPKYLK